MITMNKYKYYVLKYKNGKCYLKPLTSKKSKCKKHKKTCLKKSKCPKYQKKYLKKYLKNYTELVISLAPYKFGALDMPPTISFYINKSFTPSQVSRLKRSLSGMMYILSNYFMEKHSGAIISKRSDGSRLTQCIKPYATKNFYPVWYKGPRFTNNVQAANFALDRIVQMISDNGYKNAPPAFIDPINLPYPKVVYSPTVPKSSCVSLSFSANLLAVDSSSLSDLVFTGALLHTWLHRAGYGGPNRTNFLTTEIALCVMKGFSGRTTRPDSEFTSLLT